MEQFEGFPKISRLLRECIVTEKIDGTNAQIYIPEDTVEYVANQDKYGVPFKCGSRNRWVTPDSDNYSFARWCYENVEELLKLGYGRHFGEWWGQGIQRNYGLKEKRFSLFNVRLWTAAYEAMQAGHENDFPKCCHVVPIITTGRIVDGVVDIALGELMNNGSKAAPGFANPEGIVVYHTAGNHLYKVTLDGDGHKGETSGRHNK